MALTLMYITNNPVTAKLAQKAGVERIWVDMEYIGKERRQGGLNTVQNHHTIEDVFRIRQVVDTSELMVRINPIHEETSEYGSSEDEIEATLRGGADVIMLPFFTAKQEVERFIDCVAGRAKTMLLVETVEAVENIYEILSVPGIDEVHIGLNDLHLAMHRRFMFELLCDGTVSNLCKVFNRLGLKYGFGGIARIGYGLLPAEYIIAEHYRLGSSAAILSRSFCNANRIADPNEIEDIFIEGVRNIRLRESEVSCYSEAEYMSNYRAICERMRMITNG